MSSGYHKLFEVRAVSYLSIPFCLAEFLASGKCLINICGKEITEWTMIQKLEIGVLKSHVNNHLSTSTWISRKHLNVTSIKWGHNCFHTYHLFLCFHIFNQPFRHDTIFIDYWLCTRMYLMLLGPSASPPTLWLEQELYVFPPFPHPSPPYLSHQQVLFILSPINTEYTNFSSRFNPLIQAVICILLLTCLLI